MNGGDLIGLHRTWLEEPGRKAKVEPAKALLGPCRGGAVHLSGGAGPLVLPGGYRDRAFGSGPVSALVAPGLGSA